MLVEVIFSAEDRGRSTGWSTSHA